MSNEGSAMRIGYIIASNKVAIERKRIGYMVREEPDNDNDSGWRVFSGDETQQYADDAHNFAMYNAATILAIDPSLAIQIPISLKRLDRKKQKQAERQAQKITTQKKTTHH